MREKLLEKLGAMWRKAETKYIETEDDSEKWKVLKFQEKQKLTPEEKIELNSILQSMGV